MRDGSTSAERYTPQQVPTETRDKTCNVLDRLPPFQYRYRPVGKIAKPADGKTSLSEGGACHMGRAPRMPNSTTAMVNTQLCRKIYSNYTHVVARCFLSTGSTGYIDYEMQKEMSAAPDWMVQHMKVKRVRCNSLECDAASAPSWRTESSGTALPHGPEVSYGIPFRWSASR